MTRQEKEYLRELARRQKELANLSVMEERKKLWYLHNELKGLRPMIVMEEETFLDEILPELKCVDLDARRMERQLLKTILPEQIFQDDKVVTDEFLIDVQVENRLFNVEMQKKFASDGIGYHIEPIIESLEEDMDILGESVFINHKEETQRRFLVAQETFGDILNIKFQNSINYWEFSLSEKIVWLMGMENMFCSMVTEEDAFHQLMKKLTTEMIHFLRWQEKEGVLFLNNGNDYMGSGSYCFSKELPGDDYQGKVLSRHLWGHMNSQESIGISPEMYHEFMAPYFGKMAEEFGLVYYGCCEPVELYWDRDISQYANLRKVSISPWCNEEIMSERLSKGNVIYSRKPSPNFLGVKKEFDEEKFRKHIHHTVELTKKCHTEYIFRDIYKLHGNIEKLARAVQIVREETEK